MFRRRRFTAMLLIITVIAAGFVLFEIHFVQKATASNSDACTLALARCYIANATADLTCLLYGSNSQECIQAAARAASLCLQAVIICEN